MIKIKFWKLLRFYRRKKMHKVNFLGIGLSRTFINFFESLDSAVQSRFYIVKNWMLGSGRILEYI